MGSVSYGKLLGLVDYNIAVIGNVTLHCGIIVFLIIWERQSNYMVLFLVPSLWGFCNGAWLTISYSELLSIAQLNKLATDCINRVSSYLVVSN